MRRDASIVASALAVCVMLAAVAVGQESKEVKGIVTSRAADNMTVQSADGTKHTIILTDDTKVRMPKGLGLRKTEMNWTSLIPGLAVTVKGTPDEKGALTAETVQFSKDSLNTASMIQAGLQPTKADVEAAQKDIETNRQSISANQEQIATNAKETQDRFDSLADYDVKGEMTIYFKPGSSMIAPEDKAALHKKATNVTQLKGYLIEVKGFADSSGNPAMNQTLSKDRAEAVVNYLLQDCKIPARHILAPGAMGISNPDASNETAAGRKENRRVEVKLMINKARLAGAGGQ